jgi:hypothetical protein
MSEFIRSRQKNRIVNSLIARLLNQKLKTKMQRIFWIYLSNNFIINGLDEFKIVQPKVECGFVRITLDNCHRVADFREENRISQYKNKLGIGEIGYFAENDEKMVGSVWATVNKTNNPIVVQTFKTITYNEGVVHDNIVSEKFRGMRIGPFMESNMFELLFKEYALRRVIADINVKNRASLRMLEKMGLRPDYRILYIAVLGKPVFQLVLRKYAN